QVVARWADDAETHGTGSLRVEEPVRVAGHERDVPRIAEPGHEVRLGERRRVRWRPLIGRRGQQLRPRRRGRRLRGRFRRRRRLRRRFGRGACAENPSEAEHRDGSANLPPSVHSISPVAWTVAASSRALTGSYGMTEAGIEALSANSGAATGWALSSGRPS